MSRKELHRTNHPYKQGQILTWLKYSLRQRLIHCCYKDVHSCFLNKLAWIRSFIQPVGSTKVIAFASFDTFC